MARQDYFFWNRAPIAPLKILAMDNCKELGSLADKHVVEIRRENLEDYREKDITILTRNYDKPSYLTKAACPRRPDSARERAG